MAKKAYRNRPKQTTLRFAALPSSSPARDGYSEAVHDRLASVRYTGPSTSSSSKMSRLSRAKPALPTPEPSSQPEIDQLKRDPNVISSSEDSDEDELVLPSQKRRKISQTPLSAPTTSPTPQRFTRSSSKPTTQICLDSDDQETEITPASPTRRSTRLRRREPSQSPPHDNLHPASTSPLSKPSLDFASAETSDEDDVVLASRPLPSRRRTGSIPQKDSFIANDDDVTYISDDLDAKPRRPNRPKRSTDNFIVSDDEVSPSRRVATTQKRRKARHTRTRQEQDELDDELENLQNSDIDESPAMSRTRGGPVTTKRDSTKEHFELLRRRRAGEKIPRIRDSEDESDSVSNHSSAVNIDLIGEYDPQGDLSDDSLHEVPDIDYRAEDDDDDDVDDFIIDDSEERPGRPLRDIPLQFTSYASAKPKELFFYIIEWLVKNKIAPAFSRQDELYNLAFDRVEDQVKAQAGSRLISSAWGAEFKRVIMARPEMKVKLLPGFDEDHIRDCDACNRTNHPARYEFIFSGQPYCKKTLEPVDDSDEEDEDATGQDHDEHGYALPSSAKRYYLGRTCAANAQMGHKLTHWKHHLNESLMSYLEEQGVLSAEAIVAREKINKKKRERQAEHVVESMDSTGMIDELWSAFKCNLEDARLGMEA
ncbi:hypothetical protein PV10_04759 [Exophiala mesophila]|uniref:DUF4211 domain-containing protein n=1 Tax=Exophiala mesophila TaxID=212818 RepID=A0A0D1ZFT8_EXOME|nr:uncharacterized protein PV10_04759 [Exophiala mesophila]KIV93552.1 hypothetical protein PV10_04759 [Exophiala mesophila]